MPHNFGNTVGFPEAEDDHVLIDQGRLAGLFCRLHRLEFTGTVHVESADKYVAFSFRNGLPVFIEESGGADSIADSFIEQGMITREQYAEIITHATDSLVDSEDMMFCEQALDLGYLTTEQVSNELGKRVRSKLIAALGMEDCRIELDDSPEALNLSVEYPQALGPLVYVGVRTFYDEAFMAEMLPEPSRHYMRLLRPYTQIVEFFALDEDEAKLLRSVDPESTLNTLLESSIVERSHAMQLVGLLRIAQMVEFAITPYASVPEPERSGVRTTEDVVRTRPVTPWRSKSRDMRDTRNEAPTSPGPDAKRASLRHGAPGADPRREPDEAGSRSASTYAGRTGYVEHTGPTPRAARSGKSSQTLPATREVSEPMPNRRASGDDTSERRTAQATHASSTQHEAAQVRGDARRPNEARPDAGRAAHARPDASTTFTTQTAPTTKAAPVFDPNAEALAEAKARARERRGLMTGGAVQRLGQELKRIRVPVESTQVSAAPRENADYAKEHLKQIVARRRQATQAVSGAASAQKRDPAADLKQAQELLREQHYGKAEELLRPHAADAPDDDVLRAYHFWARFRSGAELEKKDMDSLRESAKKLLQNEEHDAFACYVIAHLAFVEKKDDVSEKFFRRAFSKDKTNKDAERHLKILERRKQINAQTEAQANRKIFGITITSGKKDE